MQRCINIEEARGLWVDHIKRRAFVFCLRLNEIYQTSKKINAKTNKPE